MRHILDVLDLVKTQIQARQVLELIEPFDMGDEIIVKVKFFQGSGHIGREFDP